MNKQPKYELVYSTKRKGPANQPPPDRSDETHDSAVQRYLDSIPDNETTEQRAERINRFRCGY